jgi:hypothetical protein
MAGRPSVFSEETAAEICERLVNGESLNAICQDDHMPAESTVRHWVVEDYQGFFAKYARARETQADRFADEIIEIADDKSGDWIERDGELVVNHEHVQRSRLRVDTRKWLMARLAPRKWGDKVIHAGDPENPFNSVTQINLVAIAPRKWDE